MKNISISLFLLATISLLLLSGCSDLDENYRHYLNDIRYSSRVLQLNGKIGVEKVYLSWTNPEDHVAKKIRIEYGNDQYVETEGLVSSTVIDALTSAVGYNFTVYTLDEFGNKSIGSSIFLTPVTQTYIDSYMSRLTTIQPRFTVENDTLVARWESLSDNSFLLYTGQIDYSYALGGEIFTGSSGNGDSNEEIVKIPGVTSPVNITFNYTMQYQPIIGNNILIDTIPKSEVATIEIDYSEGDLFEKVPGSMISRYFGIPYDNSTEFSAWYLFSHLFDGSSSDNNSWVSSSPDVDPARGGNKENNSQWPLSFTVDISSAKQISHIEIWGWENFSQAPKRFDVWGTDAIHTNQPISYWQTLVPSEWQTDWNLLGQCEVTGSPTLPGYKFQINPQKAQVRFIRIVIHEVFKPVNHVRVGMSELIFTELLPPRLIVK